MTKPDFVAVTHAALSQTSRDDGVPFNSSAKNVNQTREHCFNHWRV